MIENEASDEEESITNEREAIANKLFEGGSDNVCICAFFSITYLINYFYHHEKIVILDLLFCLGG